MPLTQSSSQNQHNWIKNYNVSFELPRFAAKKLHDLAVSGDRRLKDIGVLKVQIRELEGARNPRWDGNNRYKQTEKINPAFIETNIHPRPVVQTSNNPQSVPWQQLPAPPHFTYYNSKQPPQAQFIREVTEGKLYPLPNIDKGEYRTKIIGISRGVLTDESIAIDGGSQENVPSWLIESSLCISFRRHGKCDVACQTGSERILYRPRPGFSRYDTTVRSMLTGNEGPMEERYQLYNSRQAPVYPPRSEVASIPKDAGREKCSSESIRILESLANSLVTVDERAGEALSGDYPVSKNSNQEVKHVSKNINQEVKPVSKNSKQEVKHMLMDSVPGHQKLVTSSEQTRTSSVSLQRQHVKRLMEPSPLSYGESISREHFHKQPISISNKKTEPLRRASFDNVKEDANGNYKRHTGRDIPLGFDGYSQAGSLKFENKSSEQKIGIEDGKGAKEIGQSFDAGFAGNLIIQREKSPCDVIEKKAEEQEQRLMAFEFAHVQKQGQEVNQKESYEICEHVVDAKKQESEMSLVRSEEKTNSSTERKSPAMGEKTVNANTKKIFPGTIHSFPGTTDNIPGTSHNIPGTSHNIPGTSHNIPGTSHNIPGGSLPISVNLDSDYLRGITAKGAEVKMKRPVVKQEGPSEQSAMQGTFPPVLTSVTTQTGVRIKRKRGRPPKSEANVANAGTPEQAKKKRGRPPKQKTVIVNAHEPKIGLEQSVLYDVKGHRTQSTTSEMLTSERSDARSSERSEFKTTSDTMEFHENVVCKQIVNVENIEACGSVSSPQIKDCVTKSPTEYEETRMLIPSINDASKSRASSIVSVRRVSGTSRPISPVDMDIKVRSRSHRWYTKDSIHREIEEQYVRMYPSVACETEQLLPDDIYYGENFPIIFADDIDVGMKFVDMSTAFKLAMREKPATAYSTRDERRCTAASKLGLKATKMHPDSTKKEASLYEKMQRKRALVETKVLRSQYVKRRSADDVEFVGDRNLRRSLEEDEATAKPTHRMSLRPRRATTLDEYLSSDSQENDDTEPDTGSLYESDESSDSEPLINKVKTAGKSREKGSFMFATSSDEDEGVKLSYYSGMSRTDHALERSESVSTNESDTFDVIPPRKRPATQKPILTDNERGYHVLQGGAPVKVEDSIRVKETIEQKAALLPGGIVEEKGTPESQFIHGSGEFEVDTDDDKSVPLKVERKENKMSMDENSNFDDCGSLSVQHKGHGNETVKCENEAVDVVDDPSVDHPRVEIEAADEIKVKVASAIETDCRIEAGTECENVIQFHVNTESEHVVKESDHVLSKGEEMMLATDHVMSKTDHVMSGTDHVISETDHMTSKTDHVMSGTDHVMSETDHVMSTDDMPSKTDCVVSEVDDALPMSDIVIAKADSAISGNESTKSQACEEMSVDDQLLQVGTDVSLKAMKETENFMIGTLSGENETEVKEGKEPSDFEVEAASNPINDTSSVSRKGGSRITSLIKRSIQKISDKLGRKKDTKASGDKVTVLEAQGLISEKGNEVLDLKPMQAKDATKVPGLNQICEGASGTEFKSLKVLSDNTDDSNGRESAGREATRIEEALEVGHDTAESEDRSRDNIFDDGTTRCDDVTVGVGDVIADDDVIVDESDGSVMERQITKEESIISGKDAVVDETAFPQGSCLGTFDLKHPETSSAKFSSGQEAEKGLGLSAVRDDKMAVRLQASQTNSQEVSAISTKGEEVCCLPNVDKAADRVFVETAQLKTQPDKVDVPADCLGIENQTDLKSPELVIEESRTERDEGFSARQNGILRSNGKNKQVLHLEGGTAEKPDISEVTINREMASQSKTEGPGYSHSPTVDSETDDNIPRGLHPRGLHSHDGISPVKDSCRGNVDGAQVVGNIFEKVELMSKQTSCTEIEPVHETSSSVADSVTDDRTGEKEGTVKEENWEKSGEKELMNCSEMRKTAVDDIQEVEKPVSKACFDAKGSRMQMEVEKVMQSCADSSQDSEVLNEKMMMGIEDAEVKEHNDMKAEKVEITEFRQSDDVKAKNVEITELRESDDVKVDKDLETVVKEGIDVNAEKELVTEVKEKDDVKADKDTEVEHSDTKVETNCKRNEQRKEKVDVTSKDIATWIKMDLRTESPKNTFAETGTCVVSSDLNTRPCLSQLKASAPLDVVDTRRETLLVIDSPESKAAEKTGIVLDKSLHEENCAFDFVINELGSKRSFGNAERRKLDLCDEETETHSSKMRKLDDADVGLSSGMRKNLENNGNSGDSSVNICKEKYGGKFTQEPDTIETGKMNTEGDPKEADATLSGRIDSIESDITDNGRSETKTVDETGKPCETGINENDYTSKGWELKAVTIETGKLIMDGDPETVDADLPERGNMDSTKFSENEICDETGKSCEIKAIENDYALKNPEVETGENKSDETRTLEESKNERVAILGSEKTGSGKGGQCSGDSISEKTCESCSGNLSQGTASKPRARGDGTESREKFVGNIRDESVARDSTELLANTDALRSLRQYMESSDDDSAESDSEKEVRSAMDASEMSHATPNESSLLVGPTRLCSMTESDTKQRHDGLKRRKSAADSDMSDGNLVVLTRSMSRQNDSPAKRLRSSKPS